MSGNKQSSSKTEERQARPQRENPDKRGKSKKLDSIGSALRPGAVERRFRPKIEG